MKDTRPLAFFNLDSATVFAGFAPKRGYKPVAFKAGQPVAFMNSAQRAFYDALCQATRLIPCTGKNVRSFRTFELGCNDYAVCSFGGVILDPQGQAVPEWRKHIQTQAVAYAAEMQRIFAKIRRQFLENHPSFRYSIRRDDGMPLYICITDESGEEEMELLPWQIEGTVPEDQGWWIHAERNQLFVCPPFLSFAKATTWFLKNLARRQKCVLAFGGGNVADKPLLELAHYALCPSKRFKP